MAGSSSSSGGPCKHDVFLSFRGTDTRKIFVCHLYRALKQKALDAFIDSEDLSKGNKISELLKAIEDSRISIVVLSENYAASSWCLEELVNILDCMENKNQLVKPIFYEVAPDDIRNLDGKFGEAFANEFGGADKQELESWRSALTRVADLSGWVSSKYEDDGKLIEEIVDDTFENWTRISPSKATGLVGMDSHIKVMKLRLCLEKDDVRFVGIWGMGGIGKTTIAKAVYDEIACQFEHVCFLDHVDYNFTNKREVKLQEKLLSGLLKDKGKIKSLSGGRNLIMQKLGKKKVLVVLDDVGASTQIEDILGNQDSFGVGSRIIITTRDKQSLSGVSELYLYKPEQLSGEKADELFMKHAFREKQPTGDYIHLSRRAIEYADGMPLALKVLGASLCGKNEDEWKHVLDKLKNTPNRQILKVLKTSMEGLEDSEKDIFLDIACFFKGMQRGFVTELLDSRGFFPVAGLMVLEDKALITISDDECIDMHDLLQEMGRDIVHQECSKEPGRRSRLWNFEDINHVLSKNTGTEAVECIILNLEKSEIDLKIDTQAFVRMTNLRLLMIYQYYPSIEPEHFVDFDDFDDSWLTCGCEQHVTGDLEFLSNELRFLCWHKCPLKSLPSNFNPENLLKLDMSGSHIQQIWKGIKTLKKLKVIDLYSCASLVKTPDLTEVTNLERLVLDYCSSLIEVHPSISALQKLLILSLQGCEELRIHPSTIHMKSLETLNLSYSWKIKFPEFSKEMEKLQDLRLEGTAIKEVPSSINNLIGLRYLYLTNCRELERLPNSIDMKSLETLHLSECWKIDKFPDFSKEMEKLQDLHLKGTAITEVPSSINNLIGLRYLDLTNCRELERLPSSIDMKSLEMLYLSNCWKIDKFPDFSKEIEKLQDLHLEGTAIKEVPSSINNLIGLRYLDLTNCRKLERLPSSIDMKSLETLYLSKCWKIDKFPDFSKEMEKLQDLHLEGTAIKEVPSSINNLIGLHYLDLTNCRELERLPSSIDMKSLETLYLSKCWKIDKFPDFSKEMEKLQDLHLEGTAIKEVPSSINNLIGLRYLYLTNCRELERLPNSIDMKSLETLHLSECWKIDKFPDFSKEMEKLQDLHLKGTAITEVPSSINNLIGLRYLDLTNCRELERLPSSIDMKSLEMLYLSNCWKIDKFPDFSKEIEKLQDLHLEGTAIKEVPSSINNLIGLRYLDLTNCRKLERLPSSIDMKSLETLYLSKCWKIDKFPDFSKEMEKLQDLHLEGTAIKEVPSSINNLIGLRYLDLTNCRELERLPSSIDMKSLETLYLSDCWKIDKFPDFSKEMEKLQDLHLEGTAIKEVPSSINNLIGLRYLDLTNCRKLERLPSSIDMKSLETLYLSKCWKINKFPDFSKEMEKLQDLHLEGTAIKEVPSSINNLIGLRYLDLTNCRELERLPSSIDMKSLETLYLSKCWKIDKFPDFSKEMEKLQDLHLEGTAIKEVPSSINNLIGLRYLDLTNCRELERLPSSIDMKSLETLYLSKCWKIDKFPDFSKEMEKLQDLHLEGTAIKEVPSSINNLIGLRYLDLTNCRELERLPSSIDMKSLETLYLCNCWKIDKFPDFSKEMEKLQDLHFEGTAIKEVPSSINNLIGLRYLDLTNCRELERLPSSIDMKSLEPLYLSDCWKIDKFPEFSKEMEKLQDLPLVGTAIKEVPSSINNLIGIRYLDLTNCRELERLPSSIDMKSLETLYLSDCWKIDKFPDFSKEMEKLQDLQLKGTAIKEVPSSINNLIGLRYLDLTNCRELERLPSSIDMKSLETLYLSDCWKIDKFPDFSKEMEKLQDLHLEGTAIKEVPSSINNLIGLRYLDLTNCRELERLPSSIDMKSLEKLYLSNCWKIDKFLDFSKEMEKLQDLHLEGTAIKEVPSSINNLIGLRYLDLTNCRELERLPSSIDMKSLETLYLCNCWKIDKFPDFSKEMEKLQDLHLEGTAIKEVPSSINNLIGLRYLDLTNCRELERLPSSIDMKSLETLYLSDCWKIDKFPDFSKEMEKLQDLHLEGTAINEVPSSINNLIGLRYLDLTNCRELERLPSSIDMKSLEMLYLSNCWKIDKFPDFSKEIEKLQDLHLEGTAIKEVPSSINNLIGLRYLDLTNCRELERLPSSIDMKSLEMLYLSNCWKIDKFPDFSKEMEKLQDLHLEGTAIKEVPSSINNLIGLRYLDLTNCRELERLPSSIDMKSLETLYLCNCWKIDKFPDFSKEMEKLQDLHLEGTAIKEVPSSINNLIGLRYLDLTNCRELERLPSSIDMKSLETLYLSDCWKIDKFPDFSKEMEKLQDLHLEGTAIKEVPSSINNLIGLRYLDLTNCRELERLRCCEAYILCDQDIMPNLSNSCRTKISFMDPCEMRSKEIEEGRDTCHTLQLLQEQHMERKGEKEIMEMTEQEEGEGCWLLRPVCSCLSLCRCDYCNVSLRKKETEREGDRITRVSGDGELSELSSHSGLPVPEPQVRGKKRKSPWGFQ